MSLEITPDDLAAWLQDGEELAVLDLRPEVDYGYGEPLTGTPVPLAQLEGRVAQLLPRVTARAVLVDAAGSEDVQQAARQLQARGWPGVRVLAGGLRAWQQSGHAEVLHEQARVFTRRVWQERATPVVTAERVKALRGEGRSVVLLDVRTPSEFEAGHVPGAINVPGAELLERFHDVVPDSRALVVTYCAGLPRAVVGAQTLIDAGVPNDVAWLEDGTKGWQRAGWSLELGAGPAPLPASERARDAGQRLAQGLRRAAGQEEQAELPQLKSHEVHALQDQPDRTAYLLDVRDTGTQLRQPVPGATPAPGGQLFLNAHKWAAVRGARLVLVDDGFGLRAAATAHWLRRRGWDVSWTAAKD